MQQTIQHFHYEFPLPQNSTLRPYERMPQPSNKKKNKSKLDRFTYYRQQNAIIKILFLDDDHFIDQGKYPFTDPEGKLHFFKDIGNVERIVVTEAVYVGHFIEDGKIKLAIKKINQAKINLGSSQIETNDDNFEVIEVGNNQRFNQFLKVLTYNPKAGQMSIRVIIDDNYGPKKLSQVIDFQFFERENQLKMNKNIPFIPQKEGK